MKHIFLIIAGICLLVTLFLPLQGRTAGSVFPEKITIGTEDGLFLPVLFDHQLHADYSSCVECHHHTTGLAPSDPRCLSCHPGQEPARDVSCRRCHRTEQYSNEENQPEERFHTDIPGAKGAYHISCVNCHEITSSGPTECAGCHELSKKGKEFYRIDNAHSGQ